MRVGHTPKGRSRPQAARPPPLPVCALLVLGRVALRLPIAADSLLGVKRQEPRLRLGRVGKRGRRCHAARPRSLNRDTARRRWRRPNKTARSSSGRCGQRVVRPSSDPPIRGRPATVVARAKLSEHPLLHPPEPAAVAALAATAQRPHLRAHRGEPGPQLLVRPVGERARPLGHRAPGHFRLTNFNRRS